MSDGERISKQQCQKNIDKVVDKIFEEMKNTNEVYDRGNRLRCDGKVQLVRSYNDQDGKVKLSGANGLTTFQNPNSKHLTDEDKRWIRIRFIQLRKKSFFQSDEKIVDKVIKEFTLRSRGFTVNKKAVLDHLIENNLIDEIQIEKPIEYYRHEDLRSSVYDQTRAVSTLNVKKYENISFAEKRRVVALVKTLYKEKKSWFKRKTRIFDEIINRIYNTDEIRLTYGIISRILNGQEELLLQQEKEQRQLLLQQEEQQEEDEMSELLQGRNAPLNGRPDDGGDFGILPDLDRYTQLNDGLEESKSDYYTGGKRRTRRYKRRLRRYTKRYKRHAR
jgi:hypothetical protein